MQASDAARAAEIEKICFANPWPASAFVDDLRGNVCARYLSAVRGRELVGYGGMWLMVGTCHVVNLAVIPELRGQGLGRRLMLEMMKLAYRGFGIKSMTLEVRESNAAARALYDKLGFSVAGVKPRYYEDNGEDALVMACGNFTGLL